MTEILKTSLEALFISSLASALIAPIMINLLYKFGQVSGITKSKIGGGEGDNTLFMKIMKSTTTNGTPNMGGMLIWIVVPIITLILLPVTEISRIFLIGFSLFGLWGFIDVVVFTNGFKKNEKMRVLQESFEWRLFKLCFAMLMNIGIMFLLKRSGYISSINIIDSLALNFTPIIAIISGVVGQFAIYSAELSDGADGLMIGIFIIITVGMSTLLLIQGKYDFLPILGIILGVQLVDLYFNIPPARFWNGGPGAMPLGFAMYFIAFATNNLIPYFLMSSITWIIMLSSMMQIVSMKFFHRRVFKIAPIHHHFQANGWPQYKVVMRFWLFALFTSIIGIYIGIAI